MHKRFSPKYKPHVHDKNLHNHLNVLFIMKKMIKNDRNVFLWLHFTFSITQEVKL